LTDEMYLVFLLLVYSGLRLEHIVRMLAGFNPARLEFVGKIARYAMDDEGVEGIKDAYECYMPAWLGKKLLEVGQFNISYNEAKRDINYKAKSGKTISAKYIRKWTNNFLFNNDVPKDERNFILGRSGEIEGSVEFHNYLELRTKADKEYLRVVDRFPKLGGGF
jgi:intergrase/recombinase